MSELASAAVGQTTLLAKGATKTRPCLPATGSHFYPCTEQSLAELLRCACKYHCFRYPDALIFLTTVYTIGTGGMKTSKELMQLADNSIVTGTGGKIDSSNRDILHHGHVL